MTILLTGDLHLSANPRDAYRHDFQAQLRKLVRKHKVEGVVILGDLTEEKDRHPAWLVNKVVEHIARLAKLCDVAIIAGNHDYLDEQSPFFEFTKRLRRVYWYNHPCDVKELMPPALARLGSVLLVPHKAGLKQSPSAKEHQWVFTHLTFQSAHVGHGRQMKGVPLDTFGRARVISGDIHVPQTIQNVTYVGSPYLVDFGDQFEPRIILLEGTRIKSIPCKGPQKRLISLASLKELEVGSVPIRYVNDGDIVKVRFLVTPENREHWDEIKHKIRVWGERRGIIIHSIQPELLEKLRSKAAKPTKHRTRSDEELVKAYAKHRSIDERRLKTGLRITRSV